MARAVRGVKEGIEQEELQRESEPRRILVLGEPWLGEIEVAEIVDLEEATWEQGRGKVVQGLAIAFVLLLFLLAGYAGVTKDRQLISEVLSIDKIGLIFVGVWATGKLALRVLRHYDDRSKEESQEGSGDSGSECRVL